MDAKLQELVEANSDYFKILDNGRIECTLNNHQFPPQLPVLEAFINGKKFNKLKIRHASEVLAKKYDPILIQSRNAPEMLFCTITGQLIDKSEAKIKQHFEGKRYQRAKERIDNDQGNVWEEPDLDEIRAELEADDDVSMDVEDELFEPLGEEIAAAVGVEIPKNTGSGSDSSEEDEDDVEEKQPAKKNSKQANGGAAASTKKKRAGKQDTAAAQRKKAKK